MPSKYAFITRQEARELEQDQLVKQAEHDTNQRAIRQRAREDLEGQRQSAMAAALAATISTTSSVIIDILTDYAQVEYTADITIQQQSAPPSLHSWSAQRDNAPLITVFLFVQTAPIKPNPDVDAEGQTLFRIESSLFVDGKETLNFQQLLLVLQTYTGLVTRKSARAMELHGRLRANLPA